MIEPTVLETDAKGELAIPAAALGAGPHARFPLEQDGHVLRLIPKGSDLAETRSPRERARAFREWVARLPKRKGPGIPAEALRRENMYD